MEMKLEGIAWKFGDNIDTDVIIPARFLNISDKEELAKSCFADLRPGFYQCVQKGDILVAGSNFGSGSSREHAPLAIKEAGISAIIAKSYARIFYRNSFNIGLPLLESPEAVDFIREKDRITIDLITGEIREMGRGKRFFAKPIPDFMRRIVQSGGLVEYIKGEIG